MVRALWFVAAAAVAFSGCVVQSDLGDDCILVKKDPDDLDPSDGTSSVAIKEKEVTTGKDYISFGNTVCEDLVCIRDASDERPTGWGPESDADGFCSRRCVHTNADSCLTGNAKIDKGDNPFECRALILDEQTLLIIKNDNPELYRRYFGDTQSPYFCARKAKAATQQ